jgi:hypothetical protein
MNAVLAGLYPSYWRAMNELSAMAHPIAGPWGRPVDGAAACGLEPALWVSADWSSSIN